MIATWKVSSVGLHTVRLTPLTVTEPFVYRDIATFRHFFIKCIFKCKIPASFRILDFHTSSRLIYVSLHDMSIQSAIHHHAALYIHLIAHFQQNQDSNGPAFLSWQLPYTYHQSDSLPSGILRCEKYSDQSSAHLQTNT